jgi:hypothetical protein
MLSLSIFRSIALGKAIVEESVARGQPFRFVDGSAAPASCW